jgi:hypothetical protein
MVRFSAKFTAALIASGAVGATAIAQAPAQTPPAQTPPAQTPQQVAPAPAPEPAGTTETVEIDAQQIRGFAMALVEIDRIQKQYQPRLEAAPEEQRPTLVEEANAQMAGAVRAQGLEPETFNAIAAAAQEDSQLRDQIRAEAARTQPAEPAGR